MQAMARAMNATPEEVARMQATLDGLADEAIDEAVDELFCPICGRPEHGFCLGGAL
jgi:hypothetical protein